VNSSSSRILHLLHSGENEFAAQVRIVSCLAHNMDSARYELHAALLVSRGPLVRELEAAGVRCHLIGWSGDRHDCAGAVRFYRFLRRNHFDLLHQHFGNQFPRALAHLAGVGAIVFHLHGRVLESSDSSRLVYMAARFANSVVATSLAVAACVRGSTNVHVVYPGTSVSASIVEPSPLLPLTIGALARLVPLKGLSCLIEAVHLMRRPDVRVEIAGAGPQEADLRAASGHFGLAEQVHFLGWVDPCEALRRWHIFAIPSLEEGFGLAALEAMAAGLPVVATDAGGLPELVAHGETGWLVPPGNPAALASRLTQLLDNPTLRTRMGGAGRARAQEHFSPKRMAEQITTIYGSLLQEAGA
jgi:glycosyltransferase involved in cell wall biosynthesis